MSGKLGYGSMIPKITPDDVDGQVAVLTIARVEIKNLAPRDSTHEDNKLVLTFREFTDDAGEPSREYIANATSYRTLCKQLGDETENDFAAWVGHKIVMAPTTTTYGKETFEKLHVASVERWDKTMAALDLKAKTKVKAAK